MGVFKRPNSENYYIGLYWRGRYYRESAKTTSKRLALQREHALFEQIQKSEFIPKATGRILLQELVDLYLAYSKTKKRSYKRDLSLTNNLLSYFGNNTVIGSILPLQIEQYQTKRKDEKKALATINREVACLKAMYNKAIAWGKIKENPVNRVKLFKENNTRTRFLSQEQMKLLTDTAAPYLRNIIILALNTGMRKEEIMQLTWQNVNLDRSFINVKNTKNGEDRKVPINSTLHEMLERIKRPEGKVFQGQAGGDIKDVKKAFETLIKRVKIQDFVFHDLRHTFASHMVMSGTSLSALREILGHKTTEMTLRYAHLSPDHKAAAVERYAKYLNETYPNPHPFKVLEK